jgi:hypothetical protein
MPASETKAMSTAPASSQRLEHVRERALYNTMSTIQIPSRGVIIQVGWPDVMCWCLAVPYTSGIEIQHVFRRVLLWAESNNPTHRMRWIESLPL